MAVRRRRGQVVSFRPVGRHPRRPRSLAGRIWRRIADPVFYLKAVVALASILLIVLPLVTDAGIAALRPARTADGTCRVLSVIDGDTLSLWCDGRGVHRARLLGLDTPELYSPGCASEALAAQKATWALRRAILASDRMDIVHEGRDRYDRQLVRASLDGVDIADLMIRGGHARAYDGGVRRGWCDG
jgi:micrococcal nuclease